MTRSSTLSRPTPVPPSAQPWYRVGVMWLVVGGPLAVVVAGIATAVIAITHPDPVLERTDDVADLRTETQPHSMTPALNARNHAQTAR